MTVDELRGLLWDKALVLVADKTDQLDLRKQAFGFLVAETRVEPNPEDAYAPPGMSEALRGGFPSSTAMDHPLNGTGSTFFSPMNAPLDAPLDNLIGVLGETPTLTAAIALDGADATVAANHGGPQ